MLTGIDDSSIVATTGSVISNIAQKPKIELIDELIANLSAKIPDNDDDENELRAQLSKLDTSIIERKISLSSVEKNYSELLNNISSVKKRMHQIEERRSEIDELKARFLLLDKHYSSDLGRLDGIKEAGTLLFSLKATTCPLCGALPDHQHPEQESEMNADSIVKASVAESKKIEVLQKGLRETVAELDDETSTFNEILPNLRKEEVEIGNSLQAQNELLQENRGDYSTLVEKKLEVQSLIAVYDQINELFAKRETFASPDLITSQTPGEDQPTPTNDLSTSVLDKFVVTVEKILAAWNFPNAGRVQFDSPTRDLIISGKKRGSRGKGARSITQAAFQIGLLEYCKKHELPHPGFLVLDSPLLAYREPEVDDAEDDLSATDVHEKFYDYLSKWSDKQIIIIENLTPPASIVAKPNVEMFSSNLKHGRYGFFPSINQES